MMLLLLCGFAFLAGFIDAMVGGGGLIQLPAIFILQPQLTLMQILGANKAASFLGTTVSTIKYIRRVKIDWQFLVPAMIAAFAGSFGGALLVSYFKKEQFAPVIITSLILVLIYTVFKKKLGLHQIDKKLSKTRYYFYAVAMGGLLGFYDGLIGPGTGSFFIFGLVILFGYDFLHAAAGSKVLNCITGIAALSFFLLQDSIVWQVALPVSAANMLGNYVGSHVALKKGSAFIRIFFIVVVLALIIKLGYDLYMAKYGLA